MREMTRPARCRRSSAKALQGAGERRERSGSTMRERAPRALAPAGPGANRPRDLPIRVRPRRAGMLLRVETASRLATRVTGERLRTFTLDERGLQDILFRSLDR